MTRSRAFRRNKSVLKKLKVERRINSRFHVAVGRSDFADPVSIGIEARTPHMCSGPCCGNPRKWFGGKNKLTMQERRQDHMDLSWYPDGYDYADDCS